MDQEAVVGRVRELVEPLLSARQAELVELTCHPQGGRALVRFLVDTPQGIRLDELSALNQAIGAILEEHDVIPMPYLLEVSSPGLDRPLKNQADFDRVIGRRLKVRTAAPINEKWEYSGKLLNVNEEAIVLELNSGEKLKILLSSIAHAVQEIEI